MGLKLGAQLLTVTEPLSAFNLDVWSAHHRHNIEGHLNIWVSVPAAISMPEGLRTLFGAMRHAVLGGGKRLRPLLALAACETVGGDQHMAMRAACAVELIHAYSLVHDDMPCMDNDVLRRGQPTVHVQFGQAQALLVGDALQALAFELLTPEGDHHVAVMQTRLCRILAKAAGSLGMAGGQAIDLASVGLPLTSAQLHEMHRLKTGALLQASVLMGAHCGDASHAVLLALQDYGAAIGLAFQVVDDVLDVTADSVTLGKTAGKDAAQDKPTFVSLMGLDAANAYAQRLLANAIGNLDALQTHGFHNTHALRELADMLVNRQH